VADAPVARAADALVSCGAGRAAARRPAPAPVQALTRPPPVEIIRDPLWNNIRVDRPTLRLVDTGVFQRLRYVRQLGLAYLVYPGATHTRFEHALGAYHLARTTLGMLAERDELRRVPADECDVIRAAALLHDVGHYPFSHALEEIGVLHHERVARPLVTDGPVAALLRESIGPDAPARVFALICGEGASPLRGLISGSLDLDKIEYLKRDALMCGVPYGEIDVDRLLNALVVVDDPAPGGRRSRCARRGSRRSSRCCSRSTRCTATCTGTTRCARPRRCTSGSSTTRCAAGARPVAPRRLHGRGAAPRARRARAVAAARRAARAAAVQAPDRVPRRRVRRGVRRVDGARPRAHRRGRGPALAASSGSGRASCCSTTRRRRRCSGSTCPVLRRGGAVAR
jgi:hypothetical protein